MHTSHLHVCVCVPTCVHVHVCVCDVHVIMYFQVTEFLYQCAEASGNLRTPLATSGEVGGANSSGNGGRRPPQPITLFSNRHTRAEVAIHVLLGSQDVLEGFDMAREIIQVCTMYDNCYGS